MRAVTLLVLAVAVTPLPALASTTIASGGQRLALRVDAGGNAEVAWTAAGVRHTLLVPASGRVRPGGRLAGRDVSRPAAVAVPFAKVVRRTADGRLWALQTWPVAGRGTPDLRIARWRGTPTQLTLELADGVLTGAVSYHDMPLPRYSRTFEGRRMRVYVYLDAWRDNRWQRLGAVAPASDGSFRRVVPPAFSTVSKFRATVIGPAIGSDIVPDAVAIAGG